MFYFFLVRESTVLSKKVTKFAIEPSQKKVIELADLPRTRQKGTCAEYNPGFQAQPRP